MAHQIIALVSFPFGDRSVVQLDNFSAYGDGVHLLEDLTQEEHIRPRTKGLSHYDIRHGTGIEWS